MPRLSALTNQLLHGQGLKFGPAPTAPTGTFKVLIATQDNSTWGNNVATNLATAAAKYPGLSLSTTVSSGLSTLPTVTVGQYDSILFWPDGALSWNSSFATHNSNNGGLVAAALFNSTGVTGIPSGLMPVESGTGGQVYGVTLDSSVRPYGHPIGDGFNGTTQQVTSFSATGAANNGNLSGQFGSGYGTVNAGATSVLPTIQGANFGIAYVKNNTAPTGRTVFLNYLPVSSTAFAPAWNMTTYPDGALIILNALLWSARKL